MKTIGGIFKKKREEKKLDLVQVERATKIRVKYLQALENGDYDKLPQSTFTRGFVKNYSEFLGLPVAEMLALYRREYDETEEKKLLPQGVSETSDQVIALVSPRKVTILLVIFLFLGFFAYLFGQYQQLAGSPSLEIFTPSENSVVSKKDLEVKGKTDPDNTLKINDQTVTLQNGTFDQFVVLTEGLNTITIETIGKRGKTTTIERHVRVLGN